ncbi:MAG: GxGYxYP family putative glycoside hydrolase [Armatimonadetes bacterium]|nr:GxGYxYP family putative glycoside hydrolase [Armatimonadota bacterium]
MRIGYLAALLALATAPAWGQSIRPGLPAAITAEVVEPQALPPGSYTLVGRWTAGQLLHLVGGSMEDAGASGGRAWGADAEITAPAGVLSYGPYHNVPAGDYVAFFRLRAAGEAGDDVVAGIDAAVGRGASPLANRDLGPVDFRGQAYVQAPLAFRTAAGELECRVNWPATTSVRLDSITLFRREGPPVAPLTRMVPQPMPSGKPTGLRYTPPKPPFAGNFPLSSRPSPTLTICDVRGRPADVQTMATTIQGLVNRSEPRAFCFVTAEDPFWLDWMRKSGRVRETTAVADPLELLRRFRSSVKGAVITDPALPTTRNIATMVAGVLDGVVCSPRLAARAGLPVLADLRGRWKTSVEAYRWAYDTYWDRMSHHVAACVYHADPGLRDYLVQHRIPIIWLPGRIDGARPYARPAAEMRLMEEVLAKMPANVPVMGYSWAGEDIGSGEGPGVGLMAEFGKYLVGSPGVSNLSVHSGYPSPRLRRPAEAPLKLDRSKVYYTFVISDGDNLPVLTTANWPQLYRDTIRPTFPKAWTISPSAAVLLPDIVDWYYSNASPNDSMMAAVSGVGYTYPQQYGRRYTEPARVFDGFLRQTAATMKTMDLRTINPSGAAPAHLARYAEMIPGLQAIFADYGKGARTYDEATTATSGAAPVFHGVTGWEPQGNREKQIAGMVAQVREITPKSTPAFLHVFVCNWFFDLPALAEVSRRLGSGYEAVGPEQLAALCRREMARRQITMQVSAATGALEGRPMSLPVPLRNVGRTSLRLRLEARTEAGALTVRPATLALKPGQATQVRAVGPASGKSITFTAIGPFGRRSAVSTLCLTRKAELKGDKIPATAAFEASFEAEALPSFVGSNVAEATGSGGKVRRAEPGRDKPGHIAYGPYRPTDPGHYVAIFRLRRTGPGAGAVCNLDAAASAGSKTLRDLAVTAADLPLGQWRAIALVFDHPGGTLETRAVWTGAAALEIDRVDLYAVPKRGK